MSTKNLTKRTSGPCGRFAVLVNTRRSGGSDIGALAQISVQDSGDEDLYTPRLPHRREKPAPLGTVKANETKKKFVKVRNVTQGPDFMETGSLKFT